MVLSKLLLLLWFPYPLMPTTLEYRRKGPNWRPAQAAAFVCSRWAFPEIRHKVWVVQVVSSSRALPRFFWKSLAGHDVIQDAGLDDLT